MITTFNLVMSQARGIASAAMLMLLSCTANASVDLELKNLVADTPALKKIFTADVVINLIGQRAEQVVERHEHLYAVVLYPSQLSARVSGSGQRYCKAALGRPARELWSAKLQQEHEYLTPAVVDRLALGRPISHSFVGLESVEYSHSAQWRGAFCYIALANLQVDYPELPSVAEADQASYDQAKQEFDQGNQQTALALFQSLGRRSPEHFPNAVPYMIILLQQQYPDLAQALQADHLDLAKVNDPDAIDVFKHYLDDVEAAD